VPEGCTVVGVLFFHLKNDGFWHFEPNPGFETLLSSEVKIRTVGVIRQVIDYAYLDEELFEILQQPTLRSGLTNVLLKTWFADKAQQVQEAFRVNAFAELQQEFLTTGGKIYQPGELKNETKLVARDATFRRVIVSIYEYRCAFCGLQILNTLGQNIVDGSHIMPFSQFYDDRIDNGLSLCKNHHWAFDRGWFSVSDDFTLLVQDDLREDAPNCRPMREFEGDRLHLPVSQQYYPRLEALRWHRQHIFIAA
jgi:putative restriction endonuclease